MNHVITSNALTVEITNQARWLFFIALLGITACIVISSVGATALLLGKTSIGIFTTTASTLSTLPFMHMVKTAHNWLNTARKQLQSQ
ncbi:TRADD-N-associated membrane domain-containing protein [Nostoc sp.]